jgi:hypothetical protein
MYHGVKVENLFSMSSERRETLGERFQNFFRLRSCFSLKRGLFFEEN